MKDKIRSLLVAKLEQAYGKRKNADDMAEILADKAPADLSDAELESLATEIIENRKGNSFPSFKELVGLLRSIPKRREAVQASRKTYGSYADSQRFEATADAEKRALSFLRGSRLTVQAVDEGWVVGLLGFAIREGREPSSDEERKIVAKVRANDVDARDFDGALGSMIRKLRGAMHERAYTSLADAYAAAKATEEANMDMEI